MPQRLLQPLALRQTILNRTAMLFERHLRGLALDSRTQPVDIAVANPDIAQARHLTKAHRIRRHDRLFADIQTHEDGAIFCHADLRERKPIRERSSISLLRLWLHANPRYGLRSGQRLRRRKSYCLGTNGRQGLIAGVDSSSEGEDFGVFVTPYVIYAGTKAFFSSRKK